MREIPINTMANIGYMKMCVTFSISLTILQSDPGCSSIKPPCLALVTKKQNKTKTSQAKTYHPAIQSLQLHCIYIFIYIYIHAFMHMYIFF